MSGYSQLRGLVTFRPLERPIECLELYSPFRASWTRTVELLADELRHHGAEAAVCEVDLREEDFRQDGIPRADKRARTPGIVLSFTATAVPGKPHLRYEVGRFRSFEDNIRAVALGLQALRAVDRYGVTRRGEQYAGWKQLEAGVPSDGDAERGRDLIEAAGGDVKEAIRRSHPDLNPEAGSADFIDIMAARTA